MDAPAWMQVQQQLGHTPIVEGTVGGAAPMLVQRYLYQSVERTVSGMGIIALVTQFGGGRVREGEAEQQRSVNLPSQSLLIPTHVPTHWHYSSTIDFAVFYFLDADAPALRPLVQLAAARHEPIPFADPLVNAACQQLIIEVQKGERADEGFKERLAGLLLEQTYRVLTTPGSVGINPRHAHFSRLQAALSHIHKNLGDELAAPDLAARAGVSLAHFRRIFEDAMGMPPHRYILSARLEKARKLLTTTTLPIASIALECGFSSQSHLTACFRSSHSITPAAFRKRTARQRP